MTVPRASRSTAAAHRVNVASLFRLVFRDRLPGSCDVTPAGIGGRTSCKLICRLRGEIEGAKIGKRIMYSREQLLALMERNRTR